MIQLRIFSMLKRHSNIRAVPVAVPVPPSVPQAVLLSTLITALVTTLVIMISSCAPASARHKAKPKSSGDFDKAVVVYNQKHYQQAAASFETIVVKEPANPDASYYAGLSYQ